jgi:hypothetical protein
MLPDTPTLIANLLSKGWSERSDTGSGVSYRLTDVGLEAKLTPVKSRTFDLSDDDLA